MLGLTWNYAVSHHLIRAETSRRLIRGISARQLASPTLFIVSIVVQYLFPRTLVGPYILLLVPVSTWVMDRVLPRDQEREGQERTLKRFLWRVGTVVPWLAMIGLAIWAMNL